LTFTQATNATVAPTVTVQAVGAAWTASQVTYATRPGVTGPTATSTGIVGGVGRVWQIDITAIVQAWTDGLPNYGLMVTGSQPVTFWSFDNSAFQPTLTVEWSDTPAAPATLTPSAGGVTSTGRPVLRFDFNAEAYLGACHVQLSTSEDFTAPLWNSGTIPTTVGLLDLAATAAPSTAGCWWRVRVQNTDGVWSPWSAPAQFTVAAKPALTWQTPAGGVWTAPSPEVTWQIAGQVAYRLTVAFADDTARLVFDTGRITSSVRAFVIPEGVITETDAPYVVALQVWDRDDRVTTPGDPAYIEHRRTVTYTPDPVQVAAWVRATHDIDGPPVVTLEWGAVGGADSWTVWRNGTLIATLKQTDISANGIECAWTDTTAPPWTELTYEVRPRVAGVDSAGITTQIQIELDTIWIITPDPDRCIPFTLEASTHDLAPDPFAFLPEQFEHATLWEPLTGGQPVRMVQGQFGLSGNLAGLRIQDGYGKTAREHAENLHWLKTHPETVVHLVLGAKNLRCVLGNIMAAPLIYDGVTGLPDDRTVRLDFWSTSGPEV
jgi:hypothetical protein